MVSHATWINVTPISTSNSLWAITVFKVNWSKLINNKYKSLSRLLFLLIVNKIKWSWLYGRKLLSKINLKLQGVYILIISIMVPMVLIFALKMERRKVVSISMYHVSSHLVVVWFYRILVLVFLRKIILVIVNLLYAHLLVVVQDGLKLHLN